MVRFIFLQHSRRCGLRLWPKMVSVAVFIFGFLAAPYYVAASVDKNYQNDLREKIQVQQKVEALPNNLAGDFVDYFSGNVSFSVTDVSIPGNFSIPVKITRTLNRSQEVFSQFADWELDTPRITGVYNKMGDMNCQSPVPPDVDIGRGKSVFWQRYYRGITLHDGNGYVARLIPVDKMTVKPFNIPAGYRFYTKKHWLVTCSGKGFVALSPEGIKYTFNSVHFSYQRDDVCINNDFCISALTVASRVSKIEDRFGNNVVYGYDSRSRLVKISASDGRELSIVYEPGNINRKIQKVISGGRVWRYEYLSGRFKQDVLHKVILPDNTQWVYSLYDEGCGGPCRAGSSTLPQSYRYISNATRNDASTDPQRKKRYTLSVLHPEGANITFEFSDVYLHRFGLRLDRSQGSSPPSGKCSPVQCVGMIPSLSLTKKTIQVSQNKAYQWLLTYSESEKYPAIYTASGEPVSVLATQQMTTLSGPDAIVERVFHRVADWKEGAELWRVIKNTNGSIVSRTTKHWAKGRYYGDIFLPGSEAGIVKKAVRGLNLLKSAYSSRLAKEIIEADGSQYYTEFTDFNAYEIPQKTYESNNFSADKRYTWQTYQHDVSHWILNQPTTFHLSADGVNYAVIDETTYYAKTHAYKSLPYEEKKYGNWLLRYASYHADGNPEKIEFNEMLKTSSGAESKKYRFKLYENFKRGKPQIIKYAARYDNVTTVSESQQINNHGWVTAITDLNGNATHYSYDLAGRLVSVDFPAGWEDAVFEWGSDTAGNKTREVKRCPLQVNKTTCSAAASTSIKTVFDQLLRPLLVTKTDTQTHEKRHQVFRYNSENNPEFVSYWSANSAEPDGRRYTYDALQRIKSLDWSAGDTERTEYLTGNKVSVSNARGYVTTTSYLAYGRPSLDAVKEIAAPEGVTTTQTINIFGDITAVTQSGSGNHGSGTVTQTEHRAYDSNHHLCKVSRNDTGQTNFSRNISGQVQWLAEGVNGGSNSECTASVSAAEKVIFSYDNFADLQSVDYPGSDPDVQYMRDNEGNLTKLTAGSTQQVYEYNSLNLLENEQLTVDGHSYTVDYHYDALGRLTGLSYPDATKVNYHLNGFGEPVQATSTAQTYALNATYHPGGLLKKFNYGNGIEHIKNLNARRFPASIIEKHKTTTLLHYDYEYDAQGNITALHDYVNPAYSINTLTYDGLDRLVNTVGRSAIGNSAINYDALGNITSYTTKNSSLNYTYNSATNRLTSITGSKNYTFKYADGRGNITHNGLRSFSFNRANQLIASDKNSYFYDGNNHRVKVVDSQGETYSLYSKSGRLLYREVNGHGINYIYLGKKLIAKQSSATTGVSGYRHYKPFGETLKPSVDGIAYSGHEFDSELGLTYMKARYYDQSIGRFMSVDPVGFNAENPHSFNRYAYANNNPYKFTDPDGRVPVFLLVFVAKEVAGAVFEHYTGLPAPTVKGLAKGTIKAASKLGGRSGKQARLREMMNDPKVSSADRGWLKNDARHIEYGNKSGLRLPRNGRKSPGRKAADKGYELAHPHNKPASQGNGYAGSKLKNHADHKVETRLHRHRY